MNTPFFVFGSDVPEQDELREVLAFVAELGHELERIHTWRHSPEQVHALVARCLAAVDRCLDDFPDDAPPEPEPITVSEPRTTSRRRPGR